MRSQRSRQSGFTLIEAVTLIAIVGVLFMIGAPALGGMLARSHETSTENAFMASLMHARETAIMRHTQILVCPGTDGKQCQPGDDWQHGWMVALDANRDRKADAGSSPLAMFNALPRGTRVITSKGRPLIAFRPDGGAGGSNATLTICHVGDDRGKSVVVANSGRVRMAPARPDRLKQCLAGLL